MPHLNTGSYKSKTYADHREPHRTAECNGARSAALRAFPSRPIPKHAAARILAMLHGTSIMNLRASLIRHRPPTSAANIDRQHRPPTSNKYPPTNPQYHQHEPRSHQYVTQYMRCVGKTLQYTNVRMSELTYVVVCLCVCVFAWVLRGHSSPLHSYCN